MTDLDQAVIPLLPGARVAVRTCLNVQPSDRVVVITDVITESVGQALAIESRAAGAATLLVRLEDYAARPVLAVPPALVEAILDFAPTVSFYAASAQTGELAFRMDLSANLRRDPARPPTRHGHMPGVTAQLMLEGMAVDYDLIYAVTHRVYELAKTAKQMHITNARGTDLHVELSPDLRWVPCHGRYYQQGEWGNLPEGETYTCPGRVNGVLVAEVLGDYFSEKYGLLTHPLTLTVTESLVTRVECADAAIAADFEAYLDSSENGRRAGEFAIGTNIGLTHLVGNLLQDEKFPGMHMAFGNPYPHETGANWSSRIHVDVIPTRCTIDVDGRRIMTEGVFAPEILAGLA